MITDARLQRMSHVLDQRLGHVRCAVEAVHHRHNVSAVLRTCDSLGVHHVHLVEGDFKPSKGPARGAERWLALHRHPSAEHAMSALQDAGFAVWVADLAAPPVPPQDIPLDRPVCLWFGAELAGVSEAAKARADGVVTIPMRGFAQSLNVSVAAALALHTVAERARREVPSPWLSDDERARTLADWQEREVRTKAGIAARSRLDVSLE